VYGGSTNQSFEGSALPILDGATSIGPRTLVSIVPVAFDETARIEIALTLRDGIAVKVTGTRLVIATVGEGRRVEAFEGGE
jgi:hypothetical protein